MKYATSFISFIDNEMQMSIIEADSELDAVRQILINYGWSDIPNSTVEEIKSIAFEGDCMVGAILIPE